MLATQSPVVVIISTRAERARELLTLMRAEQCEARVVRDLAGAMEITRAQAVALIITDHSSQRTSAQELLDALCNDPASIGEPVVASFSEAGSGASAATKAGTFVRLSTKTPLTDLARLTRTFDRSSYENKCLTDGEFSERI